MYKELNETVSQWRVNWIEQREIIRNQEAMRAIRSLARHMDDCAEKLDYHAYSERGNTWHVPFLQQNMIEIIADLQERTTELKEGLEQKETPIS